VFLRQWKQRMPLVKAARVSLVGYENTDFRRITVLIRGAVAEVDRAVAAGIEFRCRYFLVGRTVVRSSTGLNIRAF
jgi:microcompartment protein CcmL/EutN